MTDPSAKTRTPACPLCGARPPTWQDLAEHLVDAHPDAFPPVTDNGLLWASCPCGDHRLVRPARHPDMASWNMATHLQDVGDLAAHLLACGLGVDDIS